MSRRPLYAWGTTVLVGQSIAEIRKLLKQHGANRIAHAEGPEGDWVQFQLGRMHFRFEVARPVWDDIADWFQRAGDGRARIEAEYRRRWRARVLWTKAQLEFADGDDREAARAMLAYLVLPAGQTFEKWAVPQIESMYESGRMPPLLGSGTQ